jgi:hypothetical protein
MKFYLNRHRFFGPGDEMPDTSFVPSMQRRKMSRLTRIVVGIAEEIAAGENLPVVFASRFGEWGQSTKQMLNYFKEKEMSPAGFVFSVHNTAPSQLSMLRGNRTAYTAISGAEHTFDAGLLEAAAMLYKEDEVLCLCATEEIPEVYRDAFDGETQEFAIGFRLGRSQAEESAIPLLIDFASRNNAPGSDFRRAQDFMRFIGPAAASPPLFEGPCCTLRRCEN